jgi:hypothetical protein
MLAFWGLNLNETERYHLKRIQTYLGMLGAIAAMGFVLVACGDDEGGSSNSSNTGGTGNTGGTPGVGGSGGTPGMGGSGGNPNVVHSCTLALATDMLGQATVTLPWANPHSSCILVDVGTVVVWDGVFASHPLTGGVSPTNAMDLISNSDQTGATASVTFDTAGDYPYFCNVHTVTMQGVVYVQQ